MQFYDVAYPAAIRGDLWKQLGFEKIAALGSEIRVSHPNEKGIAGSLCIGPAGEPLNAAAKQSPRAILISDSRLDRKLLDTLRNREVILCVSPDRIMGSAGLRRSSAIYFTSRLVKYAIKKGIRVAFISLASSEEMLCSPIQMIELAKLMGVGEDYARNALGETNKELMP